MNFREKLAVVCRFFPLERLKKNISMATGLSFPLLSFLYQGGIEFISNKSNSKTRAIYKRRILLRHSNFKATLLKSHFGMGVLP